MHFFEHANYNFVTVRRRAMLVSAAVILAGMLSILLHHGLKTSIDFSGGALVDGNNRFAVDIYKTLRSQNGNLILSPYSISLALAMTYAGARGETESQIAHTLHFAAQDQLHPAFNSLDLQLEKKPLNIDKNQEPLQLNIANAVWAEQTFSFLPEFLDTLASNYGAGIHISDFVNNFEPARKEINDWVSQQTQDKINNLLPENSVNADTRMVLVNAIYFKADWLDQFDPNNTHDMPSLQDWVK